MNSIYYAQDESPTLIKKTVSLITYTKCDTFSGIQLNDTKCVIPL